MAFTPSRGWVVLYNTNGYWYNNIPAGLVGKIANLHDSNIELVDVDIPTEQTWVIAGKGGAAWWNQVDPTLHAKLTEINTQKIDFRSVAISPANTSSWVVMSGEREVNWNNVDANLTAKIIEIYNDGATPVSFSFANAGSGILLW